MDSRYSPGARVRLTLSSLALGGDAIGRDGSFVFFVPFGAPGDEAQVRVTERRKSFARGVIDRLEKPSPMRVAPPCPVFTRCGGCHLQHIDYSGQLLLKKTMVEDALRNPGGLPGVKVAECLPSPSPWGYRNKGQLIASRGGKGAFLGYYARGTHRVVPVAECAVLHPRCNEMSRVVAEALDTFSVTAWDEQRGTGLLRHVVARVSTSGEGLLVLVATEDRLPREEELAAFLAARLPFVRGVVLNVNPSRTNVILGGSSRVLAGVERLEETIGGLRLQLSSASFFQVNTGQLENLLAIAARALEGASGAILDAYAGVGVFSLFLARRAERVVAMEESADAVEDSLCNALRNGVANVEFMRGRVEELLPGRCDAGERIDAAVLDPPRKGCDPAALDALVRMEVPVLLYISCNPVTFARDAATLVQRGYRIEEVQPLDMFPQTSHVEVAAKFVRENWR